MYDIKIYGNDKWQACIMLKEDLSKKNINYEYINILESMANLKEYLYFRDNNELFDEYKANQKLGIPLVVVKSYNETKLFIERHKADFI